MTQDKPSLKREKAKQDDAQGEQVPASPAPVTELPSHATSANPLPPDIKVCVASTRQLIQAAGILGVNPAALVQALHKTKAITEGDLVRISLG